MFAGQGLSQWDSCWDKVSVNSDLATSSAPVTCADGAMSHRDTMGTLLTHHALRQRSLCDGPAARFAAGPFCPGNNPIRNGLPPSQARLPRICFLAAFRCLLQLARTNQSRSQLFVRDVRAAARNRPSQANSRIYVATERSEGGSPVVPFIGYGTNARASVGTRAIAGCGVTP